MQGDVAAGVVDSGNPLKIGGLASSVVPTPVASGQRVNAYFDTFGYMYTKTIAQGDTAIGSTDAGNPLKIGGYSTNSIPTPVANGQRVNAWFDNLGRLHVISDSAGGGTSATQGQYLLSPPTLTNGQSSTTMLDSTGNARVDEQFAAKAEDNVNAVIATQVLPLATSTYTYTQFQNLGANATLNVKASAGNVYSMTCHNLNGSARYIQLHNTATTPGGGAVPARTYLVPGNGVIFLESQYFGPGGINFTTGIAFAFSTTEATYTAATAGDQVVEVNFK